MTAEEQKNRLLQEYRQYLALDETEREGCWQKIGEELAQADDAETNLRREAVVENLEAIKQRLAEIKQRVDAALQAQDL
jgi:hypothetical protein